jgi:DNA-binding GntR family transcriptional regulator
VPTDPTDPRGSRAASSLAEFAYDRLKADLFELALLPGDTFTEQEVVHAFGVSRTPARQALHRLAREGLVQVSSRNGWRVRPFDFERFEQLYDLRIVLELAAVTRLCARSRADATEGLDDLLRTWGVAPDARLGPSRDAALLDEAFHCTLVEETGNAEMAAVHKDVTDKISIVRRLDFTQQARVDATYAEHEAIVRAILARRAEEACALLKAHIDASRAVVRGITLHDLHAARARGAGGAPRWQAQST